MKKKIHTMLLVAGIVALIAGCGGEQPEGSSDKTGSSDVLDSVQLVLAPYAVAAQNISRFMNLQDTLFKYAPQPKFSSQTTISAYTIRAVDMLAAMGMPADYVNSKACKYKYARVYMAVDSLFNFKLYIVPVVDANLSRFQGGTDIYLDSTGKYYPPGKPETRDEETDKYVLDLNAPCPSTCATNPPMPIMKK